MIKLLSPSGIPPIDEVNKQSSPNTGRVNDDNNSKDPGLIDLPQLPNIPSLPQKDILDVKDQSDNKVELPVATPKGLQPEIAPIKKEEAVLPAAPVNIDIPTLPVIPEALTVPVNSNSQINQDTTL